MTATSMHSQAGECRRPDLAVQPSTSGNLLVFVLSYAGFTSAGGAIASCNCYPSGASPTPPTPSPSPPTAVPTPSPSPSVSPAPPASPVSLSQQQAEESYARHCNCSAAQDS